MKNADKKRNYLVAFGVVWGVIIVGAFLGQRSPVDDGPGNAPLLNDDVTWTLVAEQVVKERLKDPDSAEFTDIEVYPPSGDRPAIICGYVNSKNGFGGMTGPQRFVAGGTVLIEEKVTSEQMTIAWDKFCQ